MKIGAMLSAIWTTLIRHRNWVCEELDNLMEAHKGPQDPRRKRMKKEIDLQCKDLEFLRGCISQEESYLQEDTPEQDIPKGDDSLRPGC